jgi:transposase
LKVCLANARYVRNVPGGVPPRRKSDVADSQSIQQLHSYGLLSGSFIAEGKIRELRAYVRQRENLEKQKGIQSDRRCGSPDG